MSYILDALRKADAQRERDPARGIHAQPLHGPVGKPGPTEGRGPWFWIACVTGVVALASVGWYLSGERGQATPPAPARGEPAARAPTPTVPVVAQSAPVVGTAVQPPPPAVAPPAPAAAIQPPPVQQAAPLEPRAATQPNVRGAPQTGPGASTAVPLSPAAPAVSAPAAVPAPALPAPAAAVPAPPERPVAGLPPEAPKLVISGGVYSSNPAQRMLIVNGQVFNEASEIGPGVVLEEIKSKTAVLRFRGSRYTVGY